jgi:hypothetical protein
MRTGHRRKSLPAFSTFVRKLFKRLRRPGDDQRLGTIGYVMR